MTIFFVCCIIIVNIIFNKKEKKIVILVDNFQISNNSTQTRVIRHKNIAIINVLYQKTNIKKQHRKKSMCLSMITN